MTAVLTAFFQQRHDKYVSLKEALQEDFTDASNELKSSLGTYESTVSLGATLDSSISAKREKMSAASNMPSDIETLAEELRQLLIDRRHNIAAIADAAEALNFAETAVVSAEYRVIGFAKQLTAAATELEAAKKRQAHHDAWVSIETEDAITEVRDTATDLLALTPITVEEGEINPEEVLAAATARIENDIPEVLLVRARARATLVVGKVGNFQSYKTSIDGELFNHCASTDGSSGVVTQRWAEYETAENHLKHYALTSVSQYEKALNLLTSVVDSKELTTAENDRIEASALAADADAITTEETLHSAKAAVAAKQLDVELAIVAAQVLDINTDPAANADVLTAKSELAVLEAELTTAEGEHSAAFATAIDFWESAIPDVMWANLHAYDSAINILTTISTSDGTALTSSFTSAEAALVTAATEDDDNKTLSEALIAASALANSKTEYVRNVQRAVSMSAMRGDY